MTEAGAGDAFAPFEFLPHLDVRENLERMLLTYEKLSRHVKRLTRVQRRIKDLYGTLLLLLSHVDWEHPYAMDVARIYTLCLERGRYTEDVTPAQERDLAILPHLVATSEALRALRKAVASQEWPQVDYALRQLDAIHMEYANHVYADTGRRDAQLAKQQQAGKRGGRAPHVWEEICRRFDTLIAEGRVRHAVTLHLCRQYRMSNHEMNRGLRQRGRGSRSPKRSHDT
jgi:hypothetical protein